MQQKQTFSAQTLTLSVAAAELGRAIFGAGQTGSVRAVLLSNVLAAAAFVLLAALASVNASRLNRPGFAGKCICAAFLLWYLFELVRTAAMLHHTVRTRTQFFTKKGSGTFFVYRRFCGRTTRNGKRAKAGYHYDSGILPFALRNQVRFVRT